MWRAWANLRAPTLTKTSFNIIRKISSNFIEVSEEVRYALENKHPVVALESTIITHGMPYPNNYQCAMDVETIITERGAYPATVAILGGKIKVGLTKNDLLQLSDTRKVETIKTSRRDFGYVMANKCNGGTTVAGTLIVAKEVGIPVFATGGIGGVHREGEHTFDISADLTELGKSPVAVISSGVKSILDIPKTLEYLETQGVFVATFGENKAFPAFYCRSSGYDSPYNVERAKEAADIIRCHLELGLKSGLLFAVPVPEEFAMNEKEMNAVIEQSMASAKKAGVSGKQITPYLLTHIAWLTKGTSLNTNVALIKNNAKVAADIAVELAELQQRHSSNIPRRKRDENKKIKNQPVIIGGSNLDCCATLKGTEITLDGRIHDATVKLHAGGVGRNITEALSKLGCNPTFISVVGNDSNGQYLCSLLPASCSEGVKKLADFNTAQCTIIFDSHGECKMLIGDMEVHQQITPNMIKSQEEVIRKSPLLVLDANLSLPTLSTALELAEEHNIPVFFEPTDVPISSKPFQTSYWKAIKYITPNLLELKEIANALNIPLSTNNLNEIEEASYLAKLIADYIPNIIVTLGSNGLLMARRANASDPLFQHQSVVDTKAEINLRHYPAEKVSDVVNVSGAGDCLASGIIAAMLRGCSEEECVKVGFAAARTALYSNSAVPSILFDQTHESWLSKAIYQTIH